jgi:hypothetical protein
MRFVELKSEKQLDMQTLHVARERLEFDTLSRGGGVTVW